jgi:hypothetical protein
MYADKARENTPFVIRRLACNWIGETTIVAFSSLTSTIYHPS